MQPLKVCGFCTYYGGYDDSDLHGFCHKRNEFTDALNAVTNNFNDCFSRATYINVRVFCRVAELLPKGTSIKELCELTGVKYGDDTDA